MSAISFERDFSRHPIHYFTLLCIMLVGLWGLFWFSYKPAMQFSIVISISVSFIVWGIIHHYEHHNLNLKILVEYVLWAAFAVMLFGSLLIRT